MTTNKRFIFVDNFSSDEAGMDILDKYTNKRYNEYHMGKVLDFLNELNDENEQLKQGLNVCRNARDNYSKRIIELEKENMQLKEQLEEMIEIFNDSGLDYFISDELEEILND